ncbi:MAG: AraC family transcriptional regulator [Lentisphaerae bacterium]|nr:MAG: AraC family transcriptional regulator [Lentisphaerota bacterium]
MNFKLNDIRLALSSINPNLFKVHATGYVSGKAGDKFSWNQPDSLLLELVTSGKGFLHVTGQEWHLVAGDCYLLYRQDAQYWSDPAEPWQKVFCIVSGKLVEALLELYLPSTIIVHNALPSAGDFFRLHQMVIEKDVAFVRDAPLLFHRIIGALAAQLQKESIDPASIPDFVVRARNYMDAHYQESLSMTELAAFSGVSPSHLIRSFRRYFACTPYEYYLTRRIEAAKTMLLTTSLKVREIAEKLNFSDEYYFSNVFRRRVGVSPSAFRKVSGRLSD